MLNKVLFTGFLFLLSFGNVACSSLVDLTAGTANVASVARDYCDLDVASRQIIRNGMNEKLEEEAYIEITCKSDNEDINKSRLP